MFSTDFIFRQQENLVDNQKCWAGFRPLCNKILLLQNKPIVHIANVLSVNAVQIVLCWLKVLSMYIQYTYYLLHMPKEYFYTILDSIQDTNTTESLMPTR